MPGIAGLKFTIEDIKKLYAYCLENRVEPKTVETKAQASMFNKRDRLVARLLGLNIYHEWNVGDRYYELPIKAKEETPIITPGPLGMGQDGSEEVDDKPEKSKQGRSKNKDLSGVDGKQKRRSNKNWKVIKDD
jgi:hypothetical protein